MADGGVRGGNGCLKAVAALVLILASIGAGFWYLGNSAWRGMGASDPETVASASLQGLREQNRLSAFQARYVAVVTSKQTQLGFSAQKTMIMPGTVRYEVDLSKLQQRDLSWDPAHNRLTLVLPPVEVSGPEIDMDHVRQYGEGGILMALTDAEKTLDDANRHAAQQELVRQAREPAPMRLARDATRNAVERSFEMPLRAAGINATVDVYFPGEARNRPSEIWDVSRSPAQVLNDTGASQGVNR